jgi:hypothetical protein
MATLDVLKGDVERSSAALGSLEIDPKPGSEEGSRRPENRASML